MTVSRVVNKAQYGGKCGKGGQWQGLANISGIYKFPTL